MGGEDCRRVRQSGTMVRFPGCGIFLFPAATCWDRQTHPLVSLLLRFLSTTENPIRIGALYTAEFKGAALFTKKENQTRVPDVAVNDCQRISFLEDDILLDAFQNSGAAGLGTAVVDAQAYVNPNSGGSSGSSDSSLELVIVIAIIIACVAFLFLIFAIFWAWRYDKQNRQAFLSEGRKADETVDANNSPEAQKERPQVAKEAPPAPSYPSVIGGESVVDGGVYAESVISEDIQSSLSQYYAGGTSANYNYNSGRLQDAASVSSMESYGYSLDGYTPSYTVGAPALTPLPTEPANPDSWLDTKDLRQKEADKSADWGASTDYAVSPSSALDDVAAADRTDDPTDENSEVEPPSYAEDMSYMDSTMAEESAIHTTILR
jgi:hypothetical protein